MTQAIPPRAVEPSSASADADDVAMLMEFLKDSDAACPLCGYNLRNLTRPVCPECRQDLVLAVGLRRVRIGWFLVTIAPGIFSGIAAALLLMPIILVPLLDPREGPAPWFIVATDIFGWVSGLAALLLILFRYRFLRKSTREQIAWAVVIWLIHLSAFGLLLSFMSGLI